LGEGWGRMRNEPDLLIVSAHAPKLLADALASA
jgi:hypothetical protein